MSSYQYQIGERDRAFAASLEALGGLANRRQVLSILRRGASGGTVRFDAIRALDRVVPRGATDRDFDAYGLVAGLYAVYHQGRSTIAATDGDLGDSFARLGRSPGWETDRAARRLTRLLAARAATLGERLRHTVTLLRSADVPVNWAMLAHDVRLWDYEGQPVQRRWARSFVVGRAPEAADADSTANHEGEDQ